MSSSFLFRTLLCIWSDIFLTLWLDLNSQNKRRLLGNESDLELNYTVETDYNIHIVVCGNHAAQFVLVFCPFSSQTSFPPSFCTSAVINGSGKRDVNRCSFTGGVWLSARVLLLNINLSTICFTPYISTAYSRLQRLSFQLQQNSCTLTFVPLLLPGKTENNFFPLPVPTLLLIPGTDEITETVRKIYFSHSVYLSILFSSI